METKELLLHRKDCTGTDLEIVFDEILKHEVERCKNCKRRKFFYSDNIMHDFNPNKRA